MVCSWGRGWVGIGGVEGCVWGWGEGGGWKGEGAEGRIFSFYVQAKIQTQKCLNERLFILTWTHSMQIFMEIFIKPQNDT